MTMRTAAGPMRVYLICDTRGAALSERVEG